MSDGYGILDHEMSAFQKNVRKLARKEFYDSVLNRASSDGYPRDELLTLANSGLTALSVAEKYGGQDADLIALGIACEEISYADPNCGAIFFVTNLATDLIATYGSPLVVEKWLPGIISGSSICSIALTEPECGSDAASLRTRAERVQGGWLLTGEKTSITQAKHADAAIVIAQTDPALGAHGTRAFFVPIDDPSVYIQVFDDPAFKPMGRGSIAMNGTFVPDDYLMGSGESGFSIIMQEFDLSRTLIAFLVLGIAERAVEMAISYSRQRETFGKKICAYQGVSFPIAEHSTYLAAVRTLAVQALNLRTHGKPHTMQAAMLKWWAPQVAFNAINDMIVIHGQVGWSEELPLQTLLRHVSAYQIGDGTPQIQKLIIARELIGREVLGR